MSLATPFWNVEERRLRAGWRVALQLLLTVALIFLLGRVFSPIGGPRAAQALVPLVAITAAVWIAGRWLDRRRFADFGLRIDRAWWVDFGAGLGLGIVLMAAIFGVMAATGWLRIDEAIEPDVGKGFATGLAYALVLYVGVGFYEELLFRGYLMSNMAEGLAGRRLSPRTAVVVAWIVVSVLFGIGHAINPNTTPVSTINVAIAGLFVGLGFLLTGELALPIGLHTAWNFAQGALFGFPVSGATVDHARLLVSGETGPDGWTGGVFGPEGGLLGLAAMLAGSVATVGWIRARRGDTDIAASIAVYSDPRRETSHVKGAPSAPGAPGR